MWHPIGACNFTVKPFSDSCATQAGKWGSNDPLSKGVHAYDQVGLAMWPRRVKVGDAVKHPLLKGFRTFIHCVKTPRQLWL